MKKQQTLSAINKVGIFAASLFVTAVAAYLYSPTFGSHATEADVNVNINVGEVLAMGVNSDTLNLVAAINSFTHGSINVSAQTNNVYGYTLAIEDVDSNTDLAHTDMNISDAISSAFTGAKTSSEMGDNTWGFSIDETNYYKIPTVGNPVAVKRTTSANATTYETTVVDFGVKVGSSLTSGTYTDVVKFTAYVNGHDRKPTEVDPKNIDGTSYSYDACLDVRYVSNGILTDPRDGTEYTVKSLPDGQCWMTQNLRLANMTIDSTNSDMPAGMSYTVAAKSNMISPSYTSGSVMDGTWGGGGGAPGESKDFGVLYNYYAATAGTGGSDLASGTAVASICPKGWRLPTSSAEYDNLVTLYDGDSSKLLGFIYSEGLGLTRHGIAYNGSWINVFADGPYWTATSLTSDTTDYYNRGTSILSTYDRISKSIGGAIRCIAK